MKHLIKFNESVENINFTFSTDDIESAFMMGALTALEDMKDMKVTKEDRETIRRFYKHWFSIVHNDDTRS